ncbi:MAG: hypothetical protein WAT53_03900, partial [Nitrosomonas sp.]
YSQSLARESSIEITTRDGDKVSINLSNSSSSQTSISYSDIQSQNSSKISFSPISVSPIIFAISNKY